MDPLVGVRSVADGPLQVAEIVEKHGARQDLEARKEALQVALL